MKHTYIIVPFILLSACGSQQSSAEPSVPSDSSIQLPSVTPSPVSTITVDQDANVIVASGPVQPISPVVATPLPTVQPNTTVIIAPVASPSPVSTVAPTFTPMPGPTAQPPVQPAQVIAPTPAPTTSPVACAQIDANGVYNLACGAWSIGVKVDKSDECPEFHAGLINLESYTPGYNVDANYMTHNGTFVDSAGNTWTYSLWITEKGFSVYPAGTGIYDAECTGPFCSKLSIAATQCLVQAEPAN